MRKNFDSSSDYGHIIGLSINPLGELLLSVRWASSGDMSIESLIHPDNVEVL